MRVIGWLGVGVVAVAAVLTLDPALVGLSETTPVLQAIALRGLLAAIAIGLGVLLLVVGLLVRRRVDAGGLCWCSGRWRSSSGSGTAGS